MAQEKPTKTTCKDVIAACDKALVEKNKQLELSDLAIGTLKKQNGDLSSENESLRETNSKWYHNPYVMVVFGAAAGTLSYVLFKK